MECLLLVRGIDWFRTDVAYWSFRLLYWEFFKKLRLSWFWCESCLAEWAPYLHIGYSLLLLKAWKALVPTFHARTHFNVRVCIFKRWSLPIASLANRKGCRLASFMNQLDVLRLRLRHLLLLRHFLDLTRLNWVWLRKTFWITRRRLWDWEYLTINTYWLILHLGGKLWYFQRFTFDTIHHSEVWSLWL